ncbi:TIGR03085 family metal-binding protein [Rhodococcus sp. NPDC058514]|uniref:TIGR03085 family metal-binding protein n=1 Tax=unclassified Rhodococcus (in: high G+C Gram-positive bacteria) TaxID=192944 RepID=UPI003661B06C
MRLAHDERLALVVTMAEFGPDAPTLCGQWTVRDLAAHLVLRERRPDAAAGIMISALAGYTERVQASIARGSFEDLLEQIRTGPPAWSPMRPFDEQLNLAEMFVHHEDVRRGGADWQPRELDPAWQGPLWALARRMGGRAYRKASCTVVLERPDGERATVRATGGETVVLVGDPAELALHAFGRDAVRLETHGPEQAVQGLLALDRGI